MYVRFIGTYIEDWAIEYRDAEGHIPPPLVHSWQARAAGREPCCQVPGQGMLDIRGRAGGRDDAYTLRGEAREGWEAI